MQRQVACREPNFTEASQLLRTWLSCDSTPICAHHSITAEGNSKNARFRPKCAKDLFDLLNKNGKFLHMQTAKKTSCWFCCSDGHEQQRNQPKMQCPVTIMQQKVRGRPKQSVCECVWRKGRAKTSLFVCVYQTKLLCARVCKFRNPKTLAELPPADM